MLSSRAISVPVILSLVVAVTLLGCSPAAAPAPTSSSAAAKPAEPAKATEPTKAPAPVAAASPAVSFPKTEIRLGHTSTTLLNNHKGAEKFSQLVKERTNGQVTVSVFPNSQLGTDKEITEQVRNGVVHAGAIAAAVVTSFPGWEPVGVFSLPYIMKGSTEEAQYKTLVKLAGSSGVKDLAETAAKTSGIRALDLTWWYGLRHLTTKNKLVAKAEDVKGLKIRTPDAPMHKVALQMMGASTVAMGFAELYSAMQMGVVDGQENPTQTILSGKFYEVQQHLSLSSHMAQHVILVMNDKFYQSQPPELKKVLDQAALEAGLYQSELQLADNKNAVGELKAKGMTVTEIDMADWESRTRDAWKQFQPQITQELVTMVQKSQ